MLEGVPLSPQLVINIRIVVGQGNPLLLFFGILGHRVQRKLLAVPDKEPHGSLCSRWDPATD